ncbi:MAG: sporulation protein YqfD [Oscillospiraceae bacterium]|jgi:similar to stage IV sporulation protein|nr:sporulation protein YqfD [Oscillospiraceae bacterium]
MFRIIKYIFGFASFTIKGKGSERFLNLVARANINIWDINRKSQEVFVCKVTAVDFKSLRKFSRKSHVLLRLKSKHGLPFIVNKFKRKPSLIVGPFCFWGIIYLLSLFVWDISVVGNVKLRQEEVAEAVEELGLTVGTPKGFVDPKILQKAVMCKMKDLSWISINIRGSLAVIELQEKNPVPDMLDKDKPCNIVAARPGQVTRIEAYKGSAEVKNGDAVAKGALLVNGFVEDAFGRITINHADARVFALTKYVLRERLDFNQKIEFPTGKVINRRTVRFFGLKIPLTLAPRPKEDYQKELFTDRVRFGKSFLPIIFYLEKCTEQEKSDVVLTTEQAGQKAEERLRQREELDFKDIKILKRNKREKVQNGTYYTEVTYECEEDIAKKEEIFMGKSR